MKRKHEPAARKAGGTVRTLPDGRTLVRSPGAPEQHVKVPGHGFYVLRTVTWTHPNGRTWSGWEWDLSGLEIPDGALRADPTLQTYCCGGPKLWYQDIERTCVQCGQDFVFGAGEQRYWYETLSFHESSTAIRCVRCRKRARTVHALQAQLALALRATEAAPRDADRWLELAKVSAELRQATGQGDLNRGLDAARKAWRLSDERLPAALYWESVLQRLAGREAKAVQAEDAFLAHANGARGLRAWVRAIEARRAGSGG